MRSASPSESSASDINGLGVSVLWDRTARNKRKWEVRSESGCGPERRAAAAVALLQEKAGALRATRGESERRRQGGVSVGAKQPDESRTSRNAGGARRQRKWRHKCY
jgi:hypothetical protein